MGHLRDFQLSENGRTLLRETEVKYILIYQVVSLIRFNHIFELLHMAVRVTKEKHEECTISYSTIAYYDDGICIRDLS